MNQKEIVDKARKGFEEAFAKKGFMEAVIGDDKHLQQILNSLIVKEGYKVLDLGTGSGYIAFPLAKMNPSSEIIGLDIAVKTLEGNAEKAVEEGLNNLKFTAYEGIRFPFEDNTFDCVVTRYALHHFPDIKRTFSEISRVMKSNGQLFISDPTPNEEDNMRFVDAYMQLKDDGHVMFYKKEEFERFANKEGFQLDNCFMTEVIFPTNRTKDERFLRICKGVDNNIIDGYVKIVDGKELTTEKVLNLSFRLLS